MKRIFGEYEVVVDAKWRFMLPADFRKKLPEGGGESFVVKKGYDNSIEMYTVEVWEKKAEQISKLNDLDPEERMMKRLLLNGVKYVDVDSAGRILLPKVLCEQVGIKKDMVFAAQGDKVEIWDRDTYYRYMDDNTNETSALAAKLAAKGINLNQ